VTAAEHDHARFAAMFHELSPRVFAYARRQCDAASAQDVVSETFLTAWRRRGDVPETALPWLLVVARNMIANRRRGEQRRDRLAETIAQLAQVAGPGADHAVVERDVMLTALAQLSDLEREAVLLVAWDGLSNRDAATVAGCSLRAFEVRLSRARARLDREINSVPVRASHPARAPGEVI
jgi:RNA polymerase sigma-70 factor (ECF subfamily)